MKVSIQMYCNFIFDCNYIGDHRPQRHDYMYNLYTYLLAEIVNSNSKITCYKRNYMLLKTFKKYV